MEEEDPPQFEAMRVNNPAQRRNPDDSKKKSQRRANGSGMKKQANRVHHFDSSWGSYARTQTDEKIKDGDVFHIPSEGITGYMHAAWPVAVTQNKGEFHGMAEPDAWAGPRGAGHKICQTCDGSGKAKPGANSPYRKEGDTSCWGCGGRGHTPADSLEKVQNWHNAWRQARQLAHDNGHSLDHPGGFAHEGMLQKMALTLTRQRTSSYSSPGYYVVDKFGAAQDGPYNTYSLAIANLNGRDAIAYMDQPQTPPLNEPFPPGMNTVFGSKDPVKKHDRDDWVRDRRRKKQDEAREQADEDEELEKESALSDDRVNQAYERHLQWCKTNGFENNEESVAALRAHEKAKGITRAEANGIADLAYIGGGDSDWRSHKESSMSDQRPLAIREAELLQAMAANPHEAGLLMGELERIRSEASYEAAAQAEIDLASTFVTDVLTPVSTYSLHTASTDWLGDIAEDPTNMAADILTAASLWYQKISPEVRADREEFLTQAQGMARREASRHGTLASDAYQTFMEHVARIRDVTANNETLLPWAAVVPPLPPSTPQGAPMESPVVATPGNTGQPQPLSNDAEHAYLFEPDSPSTPEAMGQAGDPNNLNFYPNMDMTPEPNDDGAIQNRTKNRNPNVAGRRQANQYIKQQGGKWVITQKGTGKVLSHHDSEADAEASFRAMMQSKHGRLLFEADSIGPGSNPDPAWPVTPVVPPPYPINNPADVASASSRENLAFYPNQDATPEPNDDGADNYGGDYDARSGNPMTAAKSARDPKSVNQEAEDELAAWKRTKAEEEDRKKKSRGRNFPDSRTASSNFNGPKTSYDDYLTKISEGSTPISRELWSGMAAAASPNDPTSNRKNAGGGMAPSRLSGEPQSHDDPDGSELGNNPVAPHDRGIAWEQAGMAESSYGPTGSEGEGYPMSSHPSGQMAEDWSHVSDFPDTGPGMVPNQPVYPGKEAAAKQTKPKSQLDDDVPDEGTRTGDPRRPATPNNGAWDPSTGLDAVSPAGQAKDTFDYEHALSSGTHIDESGAGETSLGTVPVEGYEYNADRPHGEMWPWNPMPPGSGAAQVAGTPAPGMQTGIGWPQPQVSRNARLEAFRTVVEERAGR